LDQKIFRVLPLSFERCCPNIPEFGQDRTSIAKTGPLLPRPRDFAKVVVLSQDRAALEVPVNWYCPVTVTNRITLTAYTLDLPRHIKGNPNINLKYLRFYIAPLLKPVRLDNHVGCVVGEILEEHKVRKTTD
jgi:hypothetical protein